MWVLFIKRMFECVLTFCNAKSIITMCAKREYYEKMGRPKGDNNMVKVILFVWMMQHLLDGNVLQTHEDCKIGSGKKCYK